MKKDMETSTLACPPEGTCNAEDDINPEKHTTRLSKKQFTRSNGFNASRIQERQELYDSGEKNH